MSLLSEATPVRPVLAHRHSLLEGPRIGGAGELVYSDVIAGGLFECRGEQIRELVPRRRGIGGVLAHADGGWVISGKSVVHVAADGTQHELLADEDARGYNDLGVTPAGELLAGVLRYRPLVGEEPRQGRLVLLGLDGSSRVLCDRVQWPNGIGVSPDGQIVYVSDYAHQLVIAVPLEGGSASGTAGEEFARMPIGSADGLAVDVEGGVWVALGDGGGVARFHPDGQLDEVVDLPAGFVSSISFGGPDLKDVLISTADNLLDPELGGTLLRARAQVAGQPLAAVAV